MTRLTIVLTAAGLLAVGGAAAIVVSQLSSDGANATAEDPAAAPSDAEKGRRGERFFGGDPNRDVRGGQEMKPRW